MIRKSEIRKDVWCMCVRFLLDGKKPEGLVEVCLHGVQPEKEGARSQARRCWLERTLSSPLWIGFCVRVWLQILYAIKNVLFRRFRRNSAVCSSNPQKNNALVADVDSQCIPQTVVGHYYYMVSLPSSDTTWLPWHALASSYNIWLDRLAAAYKLLVGRWGRTCCLAACIATATKVLYFHVLVVWRAGALLALVPERHTFSYNGGLGLDWHQKKPATFLCTMGNTSDMGLVLTTAVLTPLVWHMS